MKKPSPFFIPVILLFCMLFLSAKAMAEHHRGHVLGYVDNTTGEYVDGHIENVQAQLSFAQNALNSMLAAPCENWSANQMKFLGLIQPNIDKAQAKIDSIVYLLEQTGDTSVLEDALRDATQPAPNVFLPGSNNTDNSLVRVLFYGPVLGKFLLIDGQDQSTTVCPEQARNLQNFIFRSAKAWQFADLTAWHINDAIKEEIHLDPDRICNGPNNHSATDPLCQ